jgi:hypothetical protein
MSNDYYTDLIPGGPVPAGPAAPPPAGDQTPPPGKPRKRWHQRWSVRIPLAALALIIGFAALGAAVANQPVKTVTVKPSAPAITVPAPTPAPVHKAAPKPGPIPVLTPGHSATFTIRSYSGGPATSLTWTMGNRVATGTHDAYGMAEDAGYESAGFQVTIRNNGPAPTEGSPDYGSSLTWTGTDGRSDDTLAQSAATLGPSDLGLTGTDILTQGSLKPGGYVSGYLIWKIPTAPGHITLLSGSADGMSQHPVLQINLGGQ